MPFTAIFAGRLSVEAGNCFAIVSSAEKVSVRLEKGVGIFLKTANMAMGCIDCLGLRHFLQNGKMR